MSQLDFGSSAPGSDSQPPSHPHVAQPVEAPLSRGGSWGFEAPRGDHLRCAGVRLTYDEAADAAYLELTTAELTPGRLTIPCESPAGRLIVDWKDGKLVGLEILEASLVLHPDLLAEAD